MLPRDQIYDYEWPKHIEDKVFSGHGLTREEVESAFASLHAPSGRAGDDDRRVFYGKTSTDRHIMVVYVKFIRNGVSWARIITARPLRPKEVRTLFRR